MNVSLFSAVSNASNLCQDEETKGFDLQAGHSWIYPTNYPVREYQFNIIQEALHKNTLVSLPTGLGKTFIAAVLMYNFYRWYPHDKVIFMAPTRPLVKQQMDACYNTMAIPLDVTAELTGSKVQQSRTEVWQNKRVFFITPQVLQNDLSIIVELGPKIKCLVFDEAHRAKGNHAYCEVIRKLLPKNKLFRVLALSATPGNSSKDVIEVMRNLLIAHVEFRSEDSADVKPYVFERALETVVVPLGEKLQEIKDQYIQILEKYTRTLIQNKLIYGNCCNLTKGRIFMVMKEFQAKNSGNRSPNYAEIMKSLNICVTLYHAYDTLTRCGLRAFLNFSEEHINKPLLSGNVGLRQILDDLREYLGPSAEVQLLPDGTFAPIPPSTKFGHPKFYKLRDIVVTHFKNVETSTRVIVFFESRESVAEAYTLLAQSYPLIKPRVFVGQRSGVTQRDQINTVKAFREGTCNTLLSTCIGEEGLDVGDVDLIICFDVATKSPVRMIQRMGRTGRKKEGRVVVLVTEGREQQTLKECLIYKSNLGTFVTNSDQLQQGKYTDNPKMIPSYIRPKCQKMFITVKKPVTTKSCHLKDMLRSMSSDGPKLDDVEVVEIKERLAADVQNFWNKGRPLQCEFRKPHIDFGKHLERQRAFQSAGEVRHSKQTEIFVSLLRFADSKRYNIPVTQSSLGDFDQNKYLKQGDIRDMFSKPNPNTLSQESFSSQISNFDKEKDITKSFPPELFEEISSFLSIKMETKETCKTCDLLFECPKYEEQTVPMIDLSSWVPPDLFVVDSITLKDLKLFAESLSPKLSNEDLLDAGNEVFEDVTFGNAEPKLFAYEIPRDFDDILHSFKAREDDGSEENLEEKSFGYQTPKSFGKVLNLLSSPVSEGLVKPQPSKAPKVIAEERELDRREILNFFQLSSLEDFFANESLNESAETIIYTPEKNGLNRNRNDISPDLFASEEKRNAPTPTSERESPILCTYEKVQRLKTKKRLFDNSRNRETGISKQKLNRENSSEISKTPEMDISDFCNLSDFGLSGTVLSANQKSEDPIKTVVEDDPFEDDFCELSDFGLTNEFFSAKRKGKEKNGVISSREEKMAGKIQKNYTDFPHSEFNQIKKNIENDKSNVKLNNHLDDFCNLPGESKSMKKKAEEAKEVTKDRNTNSLNEIDNFDISELCDLSVFGLTASSRPNEDIESQVSNKSCSKVEIKSTKETVDFRDMSDFFDDDISFDAHAHATQKPSATSDSASFRSEQQNGTVIDLTESPEKENSTKTPLIPKDKDANKKELIDLTDSDFESSPVKTRTTNKSVSQLSISQMLSLFKRTSKSPREPTPKTQKPSLNLSTKKQKSETPKGHKKIDDNNSPLCKKRLEKNNITLVGDSDDEFEDSTRSPFFARPKPVSAQKHEARKPSASKEPKKRKRLFCEFLDEEAELSEDERIVISEDEPEEDDDCFEASFIADETQDRLNNTTLHGKYLQSVKSPNRGKFKIPQKPKFDVSNVFSQEVSNEDNTYVNDSFCVDTEDIESDPNEISELERLEMKLEEMKKKKKRTKLHDQLKTKRRRILVLNDDSD